MKWTHDKPTVPGYYWYKGPVLIDDFYLKDHRLWPKTIAYVSENALKGYPHAVTFMGSTVRRFFGGAPPFRGNLPDDCQWAGPIEDPE